MPVTYTRDKLENLKDKTETALDRLQNSKEPLGVDNAKVQVLRRRLAQVKYLMGRLDNNGKVTVPASIL